MRPGHAAARIVGLALLVGGLVAACSSKSSSVSDATAGNRELDRAKLCGGHLDIAHLVPRVPAAHQPYSIGKGDT